MKYVEMCESASAGAGAAGGDACRGAVVTLVCEGVGFDEDDFYAFIRPVGGGKVILFALPLSDDDGNVPEETLRWIASLCGAMGLQEVPEWDYEMEGLPFLGYVRDGKLLKVYTSTDEGDFRFALGQVVEHKSSGSRDMVIDRQRTARGREIYTLEASDPLPLQDPYRMTLGDVLVAAGTPAAA